MYKTVNDSYVEPISFIVPRRAEVFQSDIYPPATGSKPSMSASDWFGGAEPALPPKISLESLYEGEEPVEVPASQLPKPAQVKDTPAPKPAPSTSAVPAKAEPTPERVASPASTTPSNVRGPQPTMNDNKQSMAAMADRFADKDEEESSDDETSSFEEVPKPVERPAAAVASRQEEKTGVRTPPQAQPEPTKTSSAPSPRPESHSFSGATLTEQTSATSVPLSELQKTVNGDSSAGSTGATGGAKGAAAGIKGVLDDIKNLITQQGAQIEALTKEVAGLKARLGEQ